jgi:hypothetical protein
MAKIIKNKEIRITKPQDKQLYDKVSYIARNEHRSIPEQAEHMIACYLTDRNSNWIPGIDIKRKKQ